MEPTLALELKLLLAAAGIGLIQLFIAAGSARTQQNLKWAAGARDEPMPDLTGVPARLDRAFRNFMETFPVFAVAVIVVYLAGRSGGPLGVWGCVAYVVARAVYVPLYAAGVPGIRTLVWGVSIVGILMVIAASLV